MERFRLGELVGRGAMADVYRAHDELLDRPVAVKMFRLAPDETTQHRIDTEAQALARLSHPGLVTIFGTGVDEGRPYLVMELVDGPSLQVRLRNGKLSADETASIGARLASALQHAHAHGVIHRDVKPSNILLDSAGGPHLGDFGIALVADAARLTGADEMLGTPAYLAPEQVLGNDVGPAADVYALGLVLLECLTGKLEYDEGGRVETALVRLSRPPRVPAEVPPLLADTIMAMTSFDPQHRPSAADVVDQLAALDQDTVGVPIPPQRNRFVRTTLVATLVAIAVITGLVLSLNAPTPAAGPQLPGAPAPATDQSPQASANPQTQPNPPSTSPLSAVLVGPQREPGDDNQGGPGPGNGGGPGPGNGNGNGDHGRGHDHGH